MTRIKACGFVVLEANDDFEQILSLDIGAGKPSGGVLVWPGTGRSEIRVYFQTRAEARAAIERTEHYRKAFGFVSMPEAKNCRVEPIAAVDNEL